MRAGKTSSFLKKDDMLPRFMPQYARNIATEIKTRFIKQAKAGYNNLHKDRDEQKDKFQSKAAMLPAHCSRNTAKRIPTSATWIKPLTLI
jgi:hypothetical protein